MRTTLEVPEVLLRDAARLMKVKSKSEVVRLALDEYVRRNRRQKLLSLRGRITVDDVSPELERAETSDARRRH
jgi:Arc/MetJ family transcription regulator